jgi:hypothetical protein
MSHRYEQIMDAIFGAAACVASIGAIFYSLTSWTAARANLRQEGRREILGQLARFGPSRLRRICSEIGIHFSDLRTEGDNEIRTLDLDLQAELRAALERELRESMLPSVESEVRTLLRGQLEANVQMMERLRNDAKEEVGQELKRSSAVRGEVRTELKKEIRAELGRSGQDVVLIAEAMSDMRKEVRETLEDQMRIEVKRDLRKELEPEVRKEMSSETGSLSNRCLEETESCWTSWTEQTVFSNTSKR